MIIEIKNKTNLKIIDPDKIINLFKCINIDNEWSFCEITQKDTGKWTHNYHRYPAKYIPQLVEKLIDEYITIDNPHINDPFFGCGTTIVSSLSRGYKASGTDINKIAYLITKVKSTPVNPAYLNKKIKNILNETGMLNFDSSSLFKNIKIDPLIPTNYEDKINYWFTQENKENLGKILKIIYDEEDQMIRDFFLVAFSNILKNCSLWSNGSTKPTRDLSKHQTNPYSAFRLQLMKMEKGNANFYNIVPEKVKNNLSEYLQILNGDAKTQPTADETVDLIITSSPYVTSYEYADLHQLSTIWLYFTDDLAEYKKQFIGTSLKKYENRKLKSVIANDIVDKMSHISKKMSKEIEAYFIDMEDVFDESYRILKHGGRCCFVIGNTNLKGVDILNAEIFAESLQYTGFKLDRIIKREIPLKILPQKRDKKTGRFASNDNADTEAYPVEYIVIGLKD